MDDWIINILILSVMGIILIGIFSFLIHKAVDLFQNPGED